jgi:signal transduction histidine kinase
LESAVKNKPVLTDGGFTTACRKNFKGRFKNIMNNSLNKKIIVGVIIIITPILGLIFFWIGADLLKQAKSQTLEKARVVADYVVLTRQWIVDCNGGIFVPIDSYGAQDIDYKIKCQIETSNGALQMFTPSMVTKKLSQYSTRNESYSMKLSSLDPISVDNKADEFETQALNHFKHKGVSEFYRFTDFYCDFMVPLYNTRGCVKCHKRDQKISSSIIGGLRVTVPYSQTKKVLKKNAIIFGSAGIFIIFMIIGFLMFMINKVVLKPLKELEEKGNQIVSGNFDVRVDIKTNDELEFLGQNFNKMASNLAKNHELLEHKISTATEDLAKANQELLKLDKLKSDFLHNMSHELRSPLTAARGGVTYLERTIQNPDAFQYLSIVEKNLARLTWFINNLFDFTKLEAGKTEWEFQRENITTLVQEVIEIMSPVAMEKNIKVEFKKVGDIYVLIDLERMEQVLVNILDNALKFSDSNSMIKIGIKTKDNNVEIFIKDQGPGIDKNLFKNIFKKFYTGESDHKKGGSGMGLAISKAIVDAHEGEIKVLSKLGDGAAFYITLPLN